MKKFIYLSFLIILFQVKVLGQKAQSNYTKNGIPVSIINTGNNRLIELIKEDSVFNYNVAAAEFDAGKKLAWHYHPSGQVLIITEGSGFYQERGQPKKVVSKGEVIQCAPNVQHWHGATDSSSVSYLAVYSTKKGVTVWLEPVND